MLFVDNIFLLLILLFLKHWYIDFINQSIEEINGKSIYGNFYGIKHSLKHGLATTFLFSYFLYDGVFACVLGLIDFIIHYHVDWIKTKINSQHQYNPDNKHFWWLLGTDQLMHYLTYVLLIWMGITL